MEKVFSYFMLQVAYVIGLFMLHCFICSKIKLKNMDLTNHFS